MYLLHRGALVLDRISGLADAAVERLARRPVARV